MISHSPVAVDNKRNVISFSLFLSIAITLLNAAFPVPVLAAEEDLIITLLKAKHPTEVGIQSKDDKTEELNQTTLDGVTFDSRVMIQKGKIQKVELWTSDTQLQPDVASKSFQHLKGLIDSRIKKSQLINDIPNYGDASEVKTDAALWMMDSEVILLISTFYPSRSSLTLRRTSVAEWKNDMGADESLFWKKILQEELK